MKSRLLTPALVAAGVALILGGTTAIATHDPANKPAASGSQLDTEFLAEGEEVTVLREHVKTSNPTDLILQLTSECSILTDITTTGNSGADGSTAVGQIRYSILIDGSPVPVSQDDVEKGEVVFCDRAHRQTTAQFDDNDAKISQFLRTRTANAFNWMALNVGSGEHDIEVRARFERTNNEGDLPTGTNRSEGVVGARTLVIEPVHAANDEVVAETSERDDETDGSGLSLPIGG